MGIGEICSREMFYIARSESCAQAGRLMRENHVGSLVVVEKAAAPGVPLGMITDCDLAVGVMALGLDPEKTLVEAVMRRASRWSAKARASAAPSRSCAPKACAARRWLTPTAAWSASSPPTT